jgi:hypothetical protein
VFETLKAYSPFHSTLAAKAEPAKNLLTAEQEPGVYLLENDATAYKAVWKGVAKLTIPANTYVVVPDRSANKLRSHRVVVDKIYPLMVPSHTDTRFTWLQKARCNGTAKQSRNLHKPRPTSWLNGPIRTIYREGELVTPHKLSPDTSIACSGGIHFYRRKRDAKSHYYRNR